MEAKSAAEILGFEFDWLAADAEGHVAMFSTAGGGYAPEAFLRDTNAHDEAIDALLASPASTTARLAPALPPGMKNTWRDVAERGLFAFDSDVHGGPYRLVAAPEVPIKMGQLPLAISCVLGNLELRHVRFVETSAISEHMLKEGQ